MNPAPENFSQALAGLMEVEKRIIDLATRNHLHGLRFEWNDEADFGHMADPVPVVIYRSDGKMVEAEFSLSEMAGYLGGSRAATEAKIEHILDELMSDRQPTGE
jgi:hypothetical protein